jgi:hypothetical protein
VIGVDVDVTEASEDDPNVNPPVTVVELPPLALFPPKLKDMTIISYQFH